MVYPFNVLLSQEHFLDKLPPLPIFIFWSNLSYISGLCSVIGFPVLSSKKIICSFVQFGYNTEFKYFFGAPSFETTSPVLLIIYSLSFNDAFL